MAKITRREWTSKGPLGKRVRHVAFGYTLMVNGKRERKLSSQWISKELALQALSERHQQVQARLDNEPSRLRQDLSLVWKSPCRAKGRTSMAARLKVIPQATYDNGYRSSAKTKAPGRSYGNLFSSESDLDFSVVSSNLFEHCRDTFQVWKEDYQGQIVRPSNATEVECG